MHVLKPNNEIKVILRRVNRINKNGILQYFQPCTLLKTFSKQIKYNFFEAEAVIIVIPTEHLKYIK